MATIAAFFPSLFNDWVNWDDPEFVYNNPLIKDFSLQGIKNVFETNHIIGAFIPLVLLSWMLDYCIWGLNPIGFHITNLIIHLINVILVFILVSRLTKKHWILLATTLLFGLHPMRVETVAWITARKDLLYTLFFLFSIITYTSFIRSSVNKQQYKYYFLCLIGFIAALFSKGTAVILPLVLFVFDYYYQRKLSVKLFLEKIPFILFGVYFTQVAIEAQYDTGAIMGGETFSYANSIFVGFYGYFVYIVKAIFPYDLCAYNPYPMEVNEPNPWYFYLMTVCILALTILLVIKRKKWLTVCFGFAFFFVSLIPVIQVLPIGTAITSDRFTYLPYFGLFFVIGYAVDFLIQRYKNNRKAILFFGLAYMLFLGVLTFNQSRTWKDSDTLWSKVIEEFPEDFLGYYNRASYFSEKGADARALKDYNIAIKIKPELHQIHYSRGYTYQQIGDTLKALEGYNKALKIDDSFVPAHLNRGILYMKLNKEDLALKDFNKIIELEPDNYYGYFNRAIYYKKMKLWNKEIKDITKVISSGQYVSSSYMNRAEAYEKLQEYKMALLDYEKVIEITPNNAEAYYAKGNIFLKLGELDLAMSNYNKALFYKKDFLNAYINRGIIRLNRKEFDNALADMNKAIRIDNTNELALLNRSLIYKSINQIEAAKNDLKTILMRNPENVNARNELNKLEKVIE